MLSRQTLRYFFLSLLFLWPSVAVLRAYDQVRVAQNIPFSFKKGRPSVLRVDPQGGLWILNAAINAIQKIGPNGTADVDLTGTRGGQRLFKTAEDFVFSDNGTLFVADSGANKIVEMELSLSSSPADEGLKEDNEEPREVAIKVLRSFRSQKPHSIAVSHDDIVAIGGKKAKAIKVYSIDGVLLHKLMPPPKYQFKEISSLTFGPDGVLWALDGARSLLHRFSSRRKWLGVTEGLKSPVEIATDPYGFSYVTLKAGRWAEINKKGKIIGTFGTKGRKPGQFEKPMGIALETPDRLWVAEAGNKRLQSFFVSNSDKKMQLFRKPATRVQVRLQGSLDIHADDFLYTSEGERIELKTKISQIEKFTNEGVSTQTLVLKGKGPDSLGKPVSMAIGPGQHLWVVDQKDHTLKRVSFLGEIEETVGKKGRQEGNLLKPSRLAIRDDSSFVVVDKNNTRIQVLSDKGVFLFRVGSKGHRKGQIQSVQGITVTPRRIVVLDRARKALLFYDNSGKFLKELANQEGKTPLWNDPTSLSRDEEGRLYVMDSGANRLRIFTPLGKFLADISIPGKEVVCATHHQVVVHSPKATTVYVVQFLPYSVKSPTSEDIEGDIVVTWEKSNSASSYKIYRSSNATPFVLVASTSSSPYIDVQVTPGTEYQYGIVGINDLGYEGNWAQTTRLKASRRNDVSLVSVSNIHFDPVFSAAFKYYVNHPMGVIRVKSYNDKPLRDVKLSLTLKDYTDYATDKVIEVLEPGQNLDVPVTLTFNDSVLELTEDTPVQVEVRLTFFVDNKEQVVTQNAPLMLYSRNAISWGDKSRISSFVTPKDQPIVEFARTAIYSFLPSLKHSTVGKPLAKVALFYETLNALNISYVPDPKTPYSEVSGQAEALDYVQFPRETLKRKTGDCDDTSVLLSSLLESMGVETAFVDVPGHIFVMADMEENDPDVIGLPEERFVEYRGTLWVPVETTKFGSDFLAAWQTGNSEVKRAREKGEVAFLPVLSAAEKYPPVTLVETSDPPAFPKEKVTEAFLPILESLQDEKYALAAKTLTALIENNPEDEMLEIRLGMAHVEGGNKTEGEKIFQKLLKSDSVEVQAAAQNNLGNLAYLEGKYQLAESFYADAAILSPDDGGIAVNRARVALKLGQSKETKTFLKEAKNLTDDWREYAQDFPAELMPK